MWRQKNIKMNKIEDEEFETCVSLQTVLTHFGINFTMLLLPRASETLKFLVSAHREQSWGWNERILYLSMMILNLSCEDCGDRFGGVRPPKLNSTELRTQQLLCLEIWIKIYSVANRQIISLIGELFKGLCQANLQTSVVLYGQQAHCHHTRVWWYMLAHRYSSGKAWNELTYEFIHENGAFSEQTYWNFAAVTDMLATWNIYQYLCLKVGIL